MGDRVPTTYLDKIVMDYLVREGFCDAAAQFEKESGIKSSIDLHAVEARVRITDAVMEGDIAGAIATLEGMAGKAFLRRRPQLAFLLKRQQLIEIIRPLWHSSPSFLDGTIDTTEYASSDCDDREELLSGLAFAESELAPLAVEHPSSLCGPLEQLMLLLTLPQHHPACPSAALLNFQLRVDVSKALGRELLASTVQLRRSEKHLLFANGRRRNDRSGLFDAVQQQMDDTAFDDGNDFHQSRGFSMVSSKHGNDNSDTSIEESDSDSEYESELLHIVRDTLETQELIVGASPTLNLSRLSPHESSLTSNPSMVNIPLISEDGLLNLEMA